MTEFQQQKSDVLDLFERLAKVADACGSKNVALTVRNETMSRVRDERFHLVVVGEFNHGKTTLVNAMLGESLLPTGVTPTTALVHRVQFGSDRAAFAVRRDGQEKQVSLDQLGSYGVGGSALGASSASGTDPAESEPKEVHVYVPAPFLEEGLVLIDTPGVNELNQQRAEVAYKHIPRADAIIVCLDAGQVLKRSEQEFLRSRIPESLRDKLWFVINKADILSPSELDEALRYAREQLEPLVDRPKLFAVSAEQALEGNGKSTGLTNFLDALEDSLRLDRGRVLLDNALAAAQESESILAGNLAARREALRLDLEEIERRLSILEAERTGTEEALKAKGAELRQRLGKVKGRVVADLERFSERFSEALVAETQGASAEDLRRYLPGFVEENIQKIATEQGAFVMEQLQSVAEDAVAFVDEGNREQIERLRKVLGSGPEAMDLTINTLPYDIGVFAVGATGLTVMAISNVFVGGALALAAPVMAVFFRGRADRLLKQRAADEAPEVVRQAVAKLEEAFSGQIDAFSDALFSYLEHARARVLESTEQVVRGVFAAKRDGTAALDALEERNELLVAELAEVREALGRERVSLWQVE